MSVILSLGGSHRLGSAVGKNGRKRKEGYNQIWGIKGGISTGRRKTLKEKLERQIADKGLVLRINGKEKKFVEKGGRGGGEPS